MKRPVWLGVLLAVAACDGLIGDTGDGPTNQPLCTPGVAVVGPAPMRRLAHREYVRTVRDLLGYDGAALDGFVGQTSATGFDNQASTLGVTAALADEYMRAAEAVAADAVLDLSALLPCDPAASGEDPCALAFIEELGARAYRRPLEEEHIDRLVGVFAAGRDGWSFDVGIELVVRTMLQSPHFLYRVELGGAGDGSGSVPLDGWEMATRLSYFLWGTMPDAALFAAAAEGRLESADQIAAEAERMLEDPRARLAVGDFHEQWLRLGGLPAMSKDTMLYPEFDDAFKASALEETRRFVEHVVFEGSGDLDGLLLGGYSFVDDTLAALYGVPAPGGFAQVSLPPDRRAGILTHASFLAVTSKPNQTSPVARGKAVRELLLCETLPEPPPDVDTTPPAIDPSATTRERFAQHSTDPTCASCHRLMDPIGFGFEHYDPIGRWRDEESGLPIDATGEVVGSASPGFDGAVELAQILADDPAVHACFVRNWLTWAHGRSPEDAESCGVGDLTAALEQSGGDVKALVLAIVRTEAFRRRPALVEE
jgi:hypothetical protein